MATDYTPEKPEAFERMLKLLSTCETEADLKSATLLYVLDMSYPRPDVLMAEQLTRKAKGWR